MKFPPKGNPKADPPLSPHELAHTFKFKSYAPKIFQKIRDHFSIDTDKYMESVCGNCNYLEFISNSKSGQFFFYSHDGKYMIKTQTNEENKFMKKILYDYYYYVLENPHTLLVRFLGEFIKKYDIYYYIYVYMFICVCVYLSIFVRICLFYVYILFYCRSKTVLLLIRDNN